MHQAASAAQAGITKPLSEHIDFEQSEAHESQSTQMQLADSYVYEEEKVESRTVDRPSGTEHKERINALSPGDREIFSRLDRKERAAALSLNDHELHLFLALGPDERHSFLRISPWEREAFFSLSPTERSW
ncbi:MAG: hypothetical protein ABSA33_06380 [Candidatus Micrarchaeaceae archaeon]|jgi:hypothetical protein